MSEWDMLIRLADKLPIDSEEMRFANAFAVRKAIAQEVDAYRALEGMRGLESFRVRAFVDGRLGREELHRSLPVWNQSRTTPNAKASKPVDHPELLRKPMELRPSAQIPYNREGISAVLLSAQDAKHLALGPGDRALLKTQRDRVPVAVEVGTIRPGNIAVSEEMFLRLSPAPWLRARCFAVQATISKL